MQAYKYNSIPQCVWDTHKNEGMAGFFRGIPIPGVSRSLPLSFPFISNLSLLDKDNVRSERAFILHHTSPHNIIFNLRILKTFLRKSSTSSTLQTPSPTSKPVSSSLPHDTSLSRLLHAQRRNGLPRRLHIWCIHHRHGMSL